MGSSTACFRSQVAPQLTNDEIEEIQSKSNLKHDDIHHWYSRFIHCYPNGYLNEKQFIDYYQQLYEEFSEELKPLIKQIFQLFDLNSDQKINFSEFVFFHILITDGTIEEKLQMISHFYDHQKEKDFTIYQLKDLSRNLFHLFDIQISKSNLNHFIHSIIEQNHLKKDQKINWNVFIQSILDDHQLSVEQYIPTQSDSNSSVLIHRSQIF